MAFSQSSLYSDLLAVFNNMANSENLGDNHYFARGVANAFKDFIDSGDVSTIDSGTISKGVLVTGSCTGSGTIESDSGVETEGGVTTDKEGGCSDIIYKACQYMQTHESGGDDYLADKIAEGLGAVADSAEINTDNEGQALPSPTSSPVPYKGKANGKGLVVSVTPVATGLKAFFRTMKGMESGGNEAFASELASLTFTCISANTLTVNGNSKGIDNLTGLIGTGNAS